jgi:hypothetical protein
MVEEKITIVNMKQIACYMLDGVYPAEVKLDESTGKIIFIFYKNETKEVWQKWKEKRFNV